MRCAEARRCRGSSIRPRCLALLPLLLVLPWLADAHADALTVRDAQNRSVTLAAPAQRIVALAPHIVENLFAIGAGERVVGSVAHSDYPPAAGAIERVGGVGGLCVRTW